MSNLFGFSSSVVLTVSQVNSFRAFFCIPINFRTDRNFLVSRSSIGLFLSGTRVFPLLVFSPSPTFFSLLFLLLLLMLAISVELTSEARLVISCRLQKYKPKQTKSISVFTGELIRLSIEDPRRDCG